MMSTATAPDVSLGAALTEEQARDLCVGGGVTIDAPSKENSAAIGNEIPATMRNHGGFQSTLQLTARLEGLINGDWGDAHCRRPSGPRGARNSGPSAGLKPCCNSNPLRDTGHRDQYWRTCPQSKIGTRH